jgi:hypothetical protein
MIMDYPNKVKVVIVPLEDFGDLAYEKGITKIPSVMIYTNDKLHSIYKNSNIETFVEIIQEIILDI